ncbi:ABC transporter ATP-binding protein [Clostridium vincentii]|uniref:Bacitracin export ATP-binding protein BceA n=1 Tax=Clostridium vincentii TaxID=52704 RepID=A0A2T0BDC1_9CLOT|nr:ABC transporter ATP-binding protein [Clostridium vincentii]PRR81832.1 Bacitracin export ATP-binding protein BceA [Clostridium vincentii]
MINIKGLNKHYGEEAALFYALKDIDLEISKEEFVVILGPSGSGKSTLLNIIGGIDKADSGEVNIYGKDISKVSDKELTKYRGAKIGFVFQFYNLIPNLTVEENIEVVSDISEKPFEIDYVLKAVGVLDQKGKFPKQLSGGQQQRIAIARALVKNPEILLCDEPTGALDYKSSKEILTLLKEVNKKFKTTVIIITHNNAIAQMANRIIKLKSGKITENRINDNVISPERIDW